MITINKSEVKSYIGKEIGHANVDLFSKWAFNKSINDLSIYQMKESWNNLHSQHYEIGEIVKLKDLDTMLFLFQDIYGLYCPIWR